MSEVRRALAELDGSGLDLWDDTAGASPLYVDTQGKILIASADEVRDLQGRGRLGDFLDLLAPFAGTDGSGPDLRKPRQHLRIVPGKCAGEPHLDGSRLTTVTIAALVSRCFTVADVLRLYPDNAEQSISEAIELEQALGKLAPAA